MSQNTTDCILYALFCLSRDTCHIDATELARAAGTSALSAAAALVQLERDGLVDASRARLTMRGLARAAALSAAGSGGPQVELRHSRPRRKAVPQPMAAASVIPPAAESSERSRRQPERAPEYQNDMRQ